MTLSGWSDGSKDDANASGANSLAAAVAAGALAVAATQFWKKSTFYEHMKDL